MIDDQGNGREVLEAVYQEYVDLGPPKKRVFLSAPAHNEIQQVGVETLTTSIENAGFECVYPDENMDVDVRLDLLKVCDMLITWIDGLLPKGLIIMALTKVRNQLDAAFPPGIQNLIDAGWQTLGGAQVANQKKMILLPGEAPTASGSPKGMPIVFNPGEVVAQMCSAPINLPEGNTLVEAGIARGLGIPVLAVALGPTAAGDYLLPGVLPMVGSFESLDIALAEITAAPDLEAGLALILRNNIEDLKAMEEKVENGESLLQAASGGEEAP